MKRFSLRPRRRFALRSLALASLMWLGTGIQEMCIRDRTGKPVERVSIALGRDSRVSGPQLLEAAAQGIASAGAKAVDYGMCTTPAMYMAILTDGFRPDGSIMVTASHHPWQLNGLKFFTAEGGLGFHELDEVLDLAQSLETESPRATGEIVSTPFLPTYENHLKQDVYKRQANGRNRYGRQTHHQPHRGRRGPGGGGTL